MIFDKSSYFSVCEHIVLDLLITSREGIEKEGERVAENPCKEHAGPYERRAVIAPFDGMFWDNVLRQDFGENGK
jgi:hypothetical protein